MSSISFGDKPSLAVLVQQKNYRFKYKTTMFFAHLSDNWQVVRAYLAVALSTVVHLTLWCGSCTMYSVWCLENSMALLVGGQSATPLITWGPVVAPAADALCLLHKSSSLSAMIAAHAILCVYSGEQWRPLVPPWWRKTRNRPARTLAVSGNGFKVKMCSKNLQLANPDGNLSRRTSYKINEWNWSQNLTYINA